MQIGQNNSKHPLKSKTMWGAIILVVSAAYQISTTGTIDASAIGQALTALGLGAGLVGVRDSV